MCWLSVSATKPKATTARVFFALWPPTAVAEALADYAAQAAGQFGGRATRQQTIHLTLAFLGTLAIDRLPALCAAAASVQGPSVTLTIDQANYWPHNQLLWAGSRDTEPALTQLVDQLHGALRDAGFSLANGTRKFVPHVSLVRKMPEPVAAANLPPIPPLIWPNHRFILVASTLSPNGPDYRQLAEFPCFSQAPR